MNTAEQTDKIAEAFKQAQAQFNSIAEMVEDLRAAVKQDQDGGADETEAPRRRIEEDALSVEVRSGWYCPGTSLNDSKPEEYRILLCTGGPAVQIVGKLDQWMQPDTATLQAQDWFTPWTDYRPSRELMTGVDAEAILLAYARCFYFGE